MSVDQFEAVSGNRLNPSALGSRCTFLFKCSIEKPNIARLSGWTYFLLTGMTFCTKSKGFTRHTNIERVVGLWIEQDIN